MAERVGTGWAEQRGREGRSDWSYDPEKWRRAMLIRRMANSDANARWNALAADRARHEAEARRLADPLERAKAWLGARLRLPVYAAEVADGPAGMIVVGRKLYTADQLLALARSRGWLEDGTIAPAPIKLQTAPPPPAPEFASPSGATIRSGQDDAGGEVSRIPPVPEASPQPDPVPPVAPPTNITPPQPEQKEKSVSDFRNVSVHFRGTALAELERIAKDQDVPYSTAARELIDRALAMPTPVLADAYSHADGSRECRPVAADPAAPAPLPLESIALEALLAEIRRRVEDAADDEALGEAVARAEAAEGKLAQLRAALA